MEPHNSEDIERDQNNKTTIEEQTDYFLNIAEKLMNITLRISELVEQSMRNINNRVINVQNQINGIEAQIRDTTNMKKIDIFY
ncbi:MAG: hypothetical protein ACFE9R_18540 [Candidatus Hermodarchaeota archaeon]